MKRAVKEVLKFEVIFKLITLALVNPLMKQYLEMGVTGLIGDAPDDIKEVVEEYNQKNGTSMYEWQGDGYPKGE